MSYMIERVSRALAAKHYAKRFDRPLDDDHVLMNVNGNWQIFSVDAQTAIEAMRELPEEPGPNYSAGEYSRKNHAAMIDDALDKVDA
jgi:nucleoside diphosphate kinase